MSTEKEMISVEKEDLEMLIDEAQENCEDRSIHPGNCKDEYDKIRKKYGLLK